ncbi:MAG: Acid-resistance rane protein [Nitrososphaeraceae archaeon]|nr:Acid-resistance rane protein [Nitrososphaeraceae archaeon]
MLSKSDRPKWIFAAQIGLGALAIILSVLIIINPIISVVSVIILVSILLLIVGIEKVMTGVFVKDRARFSNLGLGILVIILALIAMIFPFGTSVFLVILVAVALLFDGISRVIHGLRHKEQSTLDRAFTIGVGAIEIALAIFILVSPVFGFEFVAFVIAIALLITGIQIIVSGLTGRRLFAGATETNPDNNSR